MDQGLRFQGLKASVQGLDLPDNGPWGRGWFAGLGDGEKQVMSSPNQCGPVVIGRQPELEPKWPVMGRGHYWISPSFFKLNFLIEIEFTCHRIHPV